MGMLSEIISEGAELIEDPMPLILRLETALSVEPFDGSYAATRATAMLMEYILLSAFSRTQGHDGVCVCVCVCVCSFFACLFLSSLRV